MKVMEMKGRSEELEARVESMNTSSDLKGTFDMLTRQLQAANEDRDSMMKEKIKFDEGARVRVEEELEEQRRRMEKAREEYLKENPRDPIAELGEKLKSPLQSLAILAGGFYILPLIKSIKEGLASGAVLGKVGFALNNPTKVLDLGPPIDVG